MHFHRVHTTAYSIVFILFRLQHMYWGAVLSQYEVSYHCSDFAIVSWPRQNSAYVFEFTFLTLGKIYWFLLVGWVPQEVSYCSYVERLQSTGKLKYVCVCTHVHFRVVVLELFSNGHMHITNLGKRVNFILSLHLYISTS